LSILLRIQKKQFTVAKTKNIIQGLALSAMLIAFPAMSWYYLQAGFNYQLNARQELKDYGEIPFQNGISLQSQTIDNEQLKKNLSVFCFLNTTRDNTAQLALLKKLNRQFADEKVLFLVYDLNGNMEALKTKAATYELLNDKKVWLMDADQTNSLAILKGIQKPDFEKGKDTDGNLTLTPIAKGTTDYPYFVLVDTKLQIKNYYDYQNEDQVKRLVEHLAMIMPREKQMKPEIYREKEK